MEFELKYIVPNHRASPALEFIGSICQPDPEFGSAIVSSIYYDDLHMLSLLEKVNSDFYKTKYRVRWYRSPVSDEFYPQAFIEIKQRTGAQRSKLRSSIGFDINILSTSSLHDSRLMQISQHPKLMGTETGSPLVPTLEIRYLRQRFIHPPSGCRISVDRDIEVPRINHHRLPRAIPCTISSAVFECKGNNEQLPDSLGPLINLGLRRTSFSKYLAGYARSHNMLFDPR